jgi:hypothetical protein
MNAEKTYYISGGPMDGAETEVGNRIKKIPCKHDPSWEHQYVLEATEFGLRYVYDGCYNKLTGKKPNDHYQ